jgi:uncharacterized pyridoxamine 5'-phosphate oxidase family protein
LKREFLRAKATLRNKIKIKKLAKAAYPALNFMFYIALEIMCNNSIKL